MTQNTQKSIFIINYENPQYPNCPTSQDDIMRSYVQTTVQMQDQLTPDLNLQKICHMLGITSLKNVLSVEKAHPEENHLIFEMIEQEKQLLASDGQMVQDELLDQINETSEQQCVHPNDQIQTD